MVEGSAKDVVAGEQIFGSPRVVTLALRVCDGYHYARRIKRSANKFRVTSPTERGATGA